jgi:outer membrane protein OmpA-like peptidoglycan-associated protein
MTTKMPRFAILGSSTLLLLAFTSGCATKKYVGKQISPVEGRVTQAEKKATQQGTALETVETGLNRTNEKVIDLDAGLKSTNNKVGEVDKKAGDAAASADKAQQSATEAKTYAETRTTTIEKNFNNTIENIDKFKLAQTQQVLFDLNKSDLKPDAKKTLDDIASGVASKKRYIIEVQGYTDNRGPAGMNLALSQRRAESVVRYLTLTHKLPLRSIHLIGAGDADPVADNKTRDGRKQNRRVEIRLFAPEIDLSSAVTSAQLR